MSSNVKTLLDQIYALERQITDLEKCITNNGAEKIRIGIDYAMLQFAWNDPDLISLLNLKLNKVKDQLAPLLKRLEIVNELAGEVIKKSEGK